jgi:ribose-phosphate pyrophosphokinase
MPVLIEYLKAHNDGDMVIVSPDAGRMKVAERYTNLLDADLAYVHKRRSTEEKNAVEAKEIIGEVEGTNLCPHRRHDRHGGHHLRSS